MTERLRDRDALAAKAPADRIDIAAEQARFVMLIKDGVVTLTQPSVLPSTPMERCVDDRRRH